MRIVYGPALRATELKDHFLYWDGDGYHEPTDRESIGNLAEQVEQLIGIVAEMAETIGRLTGADDVLGEE